MNKRSIETTNWLPLIILVMVNIIFIAVIVVNIVASIPIFNIHYFLLSIIIFVIILIVFNYSQLQVYGRNTPWKMNMKGNHIDIKFFSLSRKTKTINISKVTTIDISRIMLSWRYNVAMIYSSKIIFLHNLSKREVKKIEKKWPKKVVKSKPILSWYLGIPYKKIIYEKYKMKQENDQTW